MEVTDTAKSAFDLLSYPRRDLAFRLEFKKRKKKKKNKNKESMIYLNLTNSNNVDPKKNK